MEKELIRSRKSIRLKEYDYSSPGAYFVTICLHDRACILGQVVDEAVRMSDLGRVVVDQWRRIPAFFGHVALDEFQVMPNHVHGIILIERPPQPVGANKSEVSASSKEPPPAPIYSPLRVRPVGTAPGSLGAIVQDFKKRSGRLINGLRRTRGEPVWQRNFYEHVIRGGADLERIREYIRMNPARWVDDPENPTSARRGE